MNIFISVVSHAHSQLINQLKCLSQIEGAQIVVKSNFPGDDFVSLAGKKNFHWIDDLYGEGFGKNNNVIYKYCEKNLGMKGDDLFLVLNPDVIISEKDILFLADKMNTSRISLATINLYKDADFQVFDYSIRRFPSIHDFLQSFFLQKNSTVYDKSLIFTPCSVDWAAGSFLAFRSEHYRELKGFDEGYFMYCEDIDICYRSLELGHEVTYFPDIRAVHLAKHSNRSVFSKHFYWHVRSVFRFLLSKQKLIKVISSVIT
jgi:GT2 family glycosyltransferase